MEIAEFKKVPILGILRGIEPDIIEDLTEAVIASGLKAIEMTMNTPGAAALIAKMRKTAGRRLMIGAGTVLTLDELRIALDSGATFIVSPTLIPDVVAYCLKKKIPVFPGALTPQEIYNAWSAGATMVKVFPAKLFGPAYLKEVKAPFEDIELLACGGVTTENIASFMASGASAVAFGASIFRKEHLRNREFSRIQKDIESLIASIAAPSD